MSLIRMNQDHGALALAGHDPLVIVQPGKRPCAPLFCMAGAGASVSMFFEMSIGLPERVPLFGLQARGLDGQHAPYESVATAAQDFMKSIRKAQPHGPYRLLGHSFGGWIAFEVAGLLEAEGERVEQLFIVDSDGPDEQGSPVRVPDRVDALVQLVKLYNLASAHPVRLEDADFRNQRDENQLRLLHRELVKVGLVHPNTPVDTLSGVVNVFHSCMRTSYVPQFRREGSTWLVHAADGESGCSERTQRWRQLAPAIQDVSLPGNHLTMLSGTQGREFGVWVGARL